MIRVCVWEGCIERWRSLILECALYILKNVPCSVRHVKNQYVEDVSVNISNMIMYYSWIILRTILSHILLVMGQFYPIYIILVKIINEEVKLSKI